MPSFIIFCVVLFLFSPKIMGQQYFEQYYGRSERADELAKAFVKTDDGGYILAGTTTNGGLGGLDIFLAKTDANGTPQWLQYGGTPDPDQVDIIAPAADGGCFISGHTELPLPQSTNFWLQKWSGTGALEWEKQLVGGTDFRVSLIQGTAEGDYLVLYSSLHLQDITQSKAYLMRLDAAGQTTQPETSIKINAPFLANAVVAPDGNLVWVKNPFFSENFVAEKHTLTGTRLWSATLPDIVNTGADKVLFAFDTLGGTYITATEWVKKLGQWAFDASGQVRWKSTHHFENTDERLLATTITPDGILHTLFGRTLVFGSPANLSINTTHMEQALTGGPFTLHTDTLDVDISSLVAAVFEENGAQATILTQALETDLQADPGLIKADLSPSSTSIVFTKTYGETLLYPDERLYHQQSAPDGSRYVFAQKGSYTNPAYWVFQTDATGNILREHTFGPPVQNLYNIGAKFQLGLDAGPTFLVIKQDSLFLLKLNPDLGQAWLRHISVQEPPVFFENFLILPNGDYLIRSYSLPNDRILFYRFDKNLNFVKKWEINSTNIAYFSTTNNGGFVMVGTKRRDQDFYLRLAYLDGDGNVLEDYKPLLMQNPSVLLQMPDGGFLITGTDTGGNDLGLLKVDHKAELMWKYQADKPSPNTIMELLSPMLGPCDGVIVPTKKQERDPNNFQLLRESIEWLYLDGEGIPRKTAFLQTFPTEQFGTNDPFFDNLTWEQWRVSRNVLTDDIHFQKVVFPTSVPVKPLETSILIHPNPAQHSVCAKLDNALTGTVLLQLYDPTGRLVRSQTSDKQTGAWEGHLRVEGLASGLYLLTASVGGEVFQGKIFVEK